MAHPHTSVLLKEILTFFRLRPIRFFVDATLGAGGHSEAILLEHPEIECMIGIDQDPIARGIAAKRLINWKDKLHIVPGNFTHLDNYLDAFQLDAVDGILFDLGVSSMQFDMPEKGFSFMQEGPLDMRMDPSQALTAADIVNTWTEEQLYRIFREYGEEKRSRPAAKAIIQARKQKPLASTLELADALKTALRPHPYKREIHPLTLVFQALRIAVNNELDVIKTVIPKAIHRLSPGGILAVISFHSLEDRIIKNAMQFAASDKIDTSGIGGIFLDKEPTVTLLTKKPVCPSEDEIRQNPRSRSAKLRVAEKK